MIENKPELLIIDSIQTTYSKEIPSSPGSVAQIKDVTYRLMTEIKAKCPYVIGHINKDGAIAGEKYLNIWLIQFFILKEIKEDNFES